VKPLFKLKNPPLAGECFYLGFTRRRTFSKCRRRAIPNHGRPSAATGAVERRQVPLVDEGGVGLDADRSDLVRVERVDGVDALGRQHLLSERLRRRTSQLRAQLLVVGAGDVYGLHAGAVRCADEVDGERSDRLSREVGDGDRHRTRLLRVGHDRDLEGVLLGRPCGLDELSRLGSRLLVADLRDMSGLL
jgi:hypothetical protein